MRLKIGIHEYDNVKKVTFGKYKGGLFTKDTWFADVTLVFENDEEHTTRWTLEEIEFISN